MDITEHIVPLILPTLAMLGSAIAFILSWRARANNTNATTYTSLVTSLKQMNETLLQLSTELEEERDKRQGLRKEFELAVSEWNVERRLLAQKLVHSEQTIVILEARVAQLEKEKLELSKLLAEQNKLLREENKRLKNGDSAPNEEANGSHDK